MNRKSLLVLVASLIALNADAQLNSSQTVASASTSLVQGTSMVEGQEMHKRAPGEVVKSPNRSYGSIRPCYRRPAGAFFSPMVAVDGVGSSSLGYEFLFMKPYSDYTFYSDLNGVDGSDDLSWNYAAGWENSGGNALKLTVNYGIEINDPPVLRVFQNGDPNKLYSFQYPHFTNFGSSGVVSATGAKIISARNSEIIDDSGDIEFLLSSKTMCTGGREGNVGTPFRYFYGASPYGSNSTGYWFGKNGGDILGLAQAFEKPEHPYMLQKIYIMTNNLNCTAPVDLTCKIYRMNEIPAYEDLFPAFLFPEDYEQIAIARARVTPTNALSKDGWIEFTIYGEEDGFEFEYMPTIDDAILVVFEGYNDPEAAGLASFTCSIGSDFLADEGFGELAYVNYQFRDEEGKLTGLTEWMGLNNFFDIGQMKTGFSIFLVADHPYLAFAHPDEDGEYEFGDEGGLMQNELGGLIVNGVMFRASDSCEDEEWIMTYNGSDELPDWLNIELVEGRENGHFNGIVTARVTADPLPNGVSYRNAVVRFEIPGDYEDYKFTQGKQQGYVDPLDPSIADVNAIINIILGAEPDSKYDLNRDGTINIADVNVMIDIILTH